jgi:hydrogenase maturation protease
MKSSGRDFANSTPDRALIIACGNPLRSDDGLAWRAAQKLSQTLQPREAEVVCVHQLTPELAEEASRFRTVVFLDARRSSRSRDVLSKRLRARFARSFFSHKLSPEEVLALCQRLYHRKPRGFLVSTRGARFDPGESLSAAATNALPRMIATVRNLVSRRPAERRRAIWPARGRHFAGNGHRKVRRRSSKSRRDVTNLTDPAAQSPDLGGSGRRPG